MPIRYITDHMIQVQKINKNKDGIAHAQVKLCNLLIIGMNNDIVNESFTTNLLNQIKQFLINSFLISHEIIYDMSLILKKKQKFFSLH